MSRPRLPLDHQSILTAYADGHTVTAIARHLGVDRSRIRRTVEAAGVLRDDRGAHWAARRARQLIEGIAA